MTTTDPSSIEAIAYLGCGPNRLSRLELLHQQQQHQQFHLATPSSCEHECNCMHHHPLGNHHHHSNFSTPNVSSNGAYGHHHNHFNHNHLNQHMHPNSYMSHQQQQQQLQDGILIYNNSSTNSECNQPASNNDSSQSGCSNMIHYIPTSNLSVASQSLNIPNVSCECAGHIQHPQQHHHQRQSSEQHSLQSGRSSRIISCDENNPSGTEDGSGMSTSGMITACRASKRNLWVKSDNVEKAKKNCKNGRSRGQSGRNWGSLSNL